MTTRVGLELEPLDLLFFRDGRPFEAGIRVGSTTIFPQTLAGALRTAVLAANGCDFVALGKAVQAGKSFAEALSVQSPGLAGVAALSVAGPWFMKETEPLVPMPASLLRDEEGQIIPLKPLRNGLPGWAPEHPGMLPLWTRSRGKAERLSGYLRLAGINRFLRGSEPRQRDVVGSEDLFETDSRTGIVVAPRTLTVETGLIYAADYLALRPGVSLYAELLGPEAALAQVLTAETAIPLGGQGRYVRVRRLAQPVEWPHQSRDGAGSLLLLTAPAPFAAGWRPPGLELVAAAVPGHVAVSGWDLARRGPKATRFAVAAGAVYFCRDSAPMRESLCEGDDAAVGWGSFLQGVWEHD
jgi:CRISPR-associated protein Cmr3